MSASPFCLVAILLPFMLVCCLLKFLKFRLYITVTIGHLCPWSFLEHFPVGLHRTVHFCCCLSTRMLASCVYLAINQLVALTLLLTLFVSFHTFEQERTSFECFLIMSLLAPFATCVQHKQRIISVLKRKPENCFVWAVWVVRKFSKVTLMSEKPKIVNRYTFDSVTHNHCR